MAEKSFFHEPALLHEAIEILNPQPGSVMLDATVGGGGDSSAIAERISPGGTLIAIDRDAEAVQAAEERLRRFQNMVNIRVYHSDFLNLSTVLTNYPLLNGALFDLGVSSHQLDSERGFSFMRDEPLDMRMDQSKGFTAADLLASMTEQELWRVLRENGEERWARAISRSIIARRSSGEPILTTGELAKVVMNAVPRKYWPGNIHVATRTFQSIRRIVNDEANQLTIGLKTVIDHLAPGGRLAVISFHSLEDRVVKRMFADAAGRSASPPRSSPAALLNVDEINPVLRLITRKPITITQAETERNPRSRSAVLRAGEKLPH